MFVCDVQIVESAEGVIPSLVRFDLIEDAGNDIGMGDPYFSTKKGSFHFLSSITNRELDVLHGTVRSSDKFACDEIKGRPQIMQSIADNQGKPLRERFCDSELQHMIAGLRIFRNAKTIKISADELVQGGVQFEDVLIGPFNL